MNPVCAIFSQNKGYSDWGATEVDVRIAYTGSGSNTNPITYPGALWHAYTPLGGFTADAGCSAASYMVLSQADYMELRNLGAVNESILTVAILLFGLLGFAMGYWISGPKRRSLVEVV
jgi:hypothetical protein